MKKKNYSKEDILKLVSLAHKDITRKKGKDHSPNVNELQSWIDEYISKGSEEKTEVEEKWSQKYKRSIDCNNPKGFSQRAHCQGRKKKVNEGEKLKGGLSDNKTLEDIAKKHSKKGYHNTDNMITLLKKQLSMGMKVEMEHTKSKEKAKEIALDHLSEDPNYYTKLKKVEAKESMGADSSGSFEAGAFGGKVIKRKITNIPNFDTELDEATDASSSGSYDVPFLGSTTKGRKNPLEIKGPDSIKNSRAVKDKNFPKWGGPGGVFIKIKDKCKKFPYCNQGDINALEVLRESIDEISKKTGIPKTEIENLVLNEIKQIFI